MMLFSLILVTFITLIASAINFWSIFAGFGIVFRFICTGLLSAFMSAIAFAIVIGIWIFIEYQKSNAAYETGVPMTLDKDYTYNPVPEGESMYSCFLTVSAHYFANRECISFNRDGFIGFAGWADQGNVNPILRAFLKWCDLLKNDYGSIFDERS